MYLVLCASHDFPALWAYEGLKGRGIAPLELIGVEALVCSLRWEHRLATDDGRVRIEMADGRIIQGAEVGGTLNRVLSVPTGHLQVANPEDGEYALQELNAFFMSWLRVLPGPVLNRPTPQGLCGQWRHVSEWLWLAAQAGLPTADYRLSSDEDSPAAASAGSLLPPGSPGRTVLVVAGQVVGAPAPSEVRNGCVRLAELADTELLGVQFAPSSTAEWTFVGATPFPDLTLGGEPFLDRLASVFAGEEDP